MASDDYEETMERKANDLPTLGGTYSRSTWQGDETVVGILNENGEIDRSIFDRLG